MKKVEYPWRVSHGFFIFLLLMFASGFPVLNPNLFNNNLAGRFIRRLSYRDYESSNNKANYFAAVQAIGGTDNLTTRVFWDK